MKNQIRKFNSRFGQIPNVVHKRSLLVYSMLILITGVLAIGIERLKMDMSVDSFFQEEEPIKQAYDHFRTIYW